jgi:Flp pilus assembly protein TadG
MKRLLSRLGNEDGQVLILVATGMVALVGMAALVVDVGSWFRQQRATQSIVDAAALAGAQALPTDPASAITIAKDYGAKNGVAGELTDANISITSTYSTNDTITVTDSKPASFFFGGIFNALGFNISRTASAMVGAPSEAQYVAPIGVNILHPDLTGTPGCPCFGPNYTTTLPLDKTGAPGAFDMINLNYGQTTGTVGESTMASWIQNGYQKYLPLGGYFSDPGAKYNGNYIQAALNARVGTELLFPVYDTLIGSGSNASYHIIAWVGFYLESGSMNGSTGSLTGYFTHVVWQGVVPPGGGSTGSGTGPDLGVRSVALVN